jgi:predicted ATPase/DNA-binding SARP family transcriptional activator
VGSEDRSPELRILGPLEVEGASSVGGPQQRALLAELLLAAGVAVPADRLIDAVWDDNPPPSANRALEVYASRLRQAIAPAGAQILRRGSGYQVVLGTARLDAHEFGLRAEAGRAALARGDAAGARSELGAALALWRGPALADVRGDAGRTLEEKRLAAEEDLAEAELALGLHVELVPELERRVREEPLRERSRAQLMLALYRSGRQAEALETYRDARRLLDELGLEPGRELRELEVAMLRHDAALAVDPADVQRRRRLPSPATPLVGRVAEVAEVTEVLRGPTRLLTLTGPGGIGKTRLAVQAAHDVADIFRDGVWFVGLAPLEDASLVESAISAALGLRDASLEEHVGSRELLLLLDNFEHLLQAAPLLSRLLGTAPRLKVLATSRSRLDLYGEVDYPVPALSPDDAMTLFVERARAARRGFTAGAGVAELCDRFDRLPLALELVAARTRELSVAELVESAGLEAASGGPRDLPERQRTLRAAIAWSEQRLEEGTRGLFAALGVFAGGFQPDAVEDVCPDSTEGVGTLVEAALLRRSEGGRLRMLETVRTYALERLRESAQLDDVRRRHLEHYSRLAYELAPLLLGAGDAAAHARLEQERDNLRAALAYARDAGLGDVLLGLVRDLSRFWYVHGNLDEGAVWAAVALDASAAAPTLLRAQALKGAALLDWKRGELDLAESRAEEARQAIAALGVEAELLGALSVLAAIAHSRGDVRRALARFEEGAELARALGQRPYLSIALNNVAGIHYEERRWDEARQAYEESLAVAREAGSKELEAFPRYGLGAVSLYAGDLGAAQRELSAGLSLFHELGFPDRIASCCTYLAALARARGDDTRAAAFLGAASGLRNASDATDRLEYECAEQTRAEATQALGERAFAVAFEAGAAEPDRMVREVLGTPTSTLSA